MGAENEQHPEPGGGNSQGWKCCAALEFTIKKCYDGATYRKGLAHEKSFPEYNSNELKGAGDLMRGALLETSARKILNQGIDESKRKAALNMLKRGKLTIQEIAEDLGLSVAELEQIAMQGS